MKYQTLKTDKTFNELVVFSAIINEMQYDGMMKKKFRVRIDRMEGKVNTLL